MSSKGGCLVERCLPVDKKLEADELTEQMDKLSVKTKCLSVDRKLEADEVTEKMDKMSVKTKEGTVKKTRPSRCRTEYSPKEFLQRQTERSGALAGRTKTTANMDNRILRKELLTKDPKALETEPESDPKCDKENEEQDLLDRGPVRTSKYTAQALHPYGDRTMQPTQVTRSSCSMVLGHTLIPQQSPQNEGYSAGFLYQQAPSNVDWENINVGGGYGQMDKSKMGFVRVPCEEGNLPSGEIASLERMRLVQLQRGSRDTIKELPEALSDFILKYSRRYSHSSSTTGSIDRSPGSNSGSETPDECEGRQRCNSNDSNSDSVSSACNSPMSAAAAPPSSSPAAPNGSSTHLNNKANKYQIDSEEGDGNRLKAILPKPSSRGSAAKDRLKRMFGEVEMLEAWAWAVKCVQMCPGAMYFRDPDGDSLLHIVVWHRDLAKTYALVEHMIKSEHGNGQYKPFDLPNRNNETPLFLAVEKRMEEVVAYLVECGANPNIISRRHDAESPLHYAASRGMVEIVNALCAHQITDKNLLSAVGLTSLMCAVKNHGVIEEESQCLVNNKPTIRALLKAGADPIISDATNGKTVLHYSVERMDPELVEIFRINLEKSEMKELANKASYELETPLQMLTRMANSPRGAARMGRAEAEEELRRKMMTTLIECGAEIGETICSSLAPRLSFDSAYDNSPSSSIDTDASAY